MSNCHAGVILPKSRPNLLYRQQSQDHNESLTVKNVAKLPNRNPIFRVFWAFDSLVSSSVFETWDACKRWGSAYSSFVYRFKITGPRRFVVDIVDDFTTFGMVIAFCLLAFALPPFSGHR